MKPWSDKLRVVNPYTPGEQNKNPNKIKLNANENPYPPSPKVMEVIRNFDTENLNLYPPIDSDGLNEVLANYYGVKENQVIVGNGSDDIIALCFMAFFNSKKPILFPDVTYSFYPVWCDLFNIPYTTKSVDKDYMIYAKDYYDDNGGVIFPNPNAPTGISEGREFVKEILDHNQDVIVIVDEAYVDFGGYSSVELLEEYENLVIVQTFSKSRSLAGLRLGCAIASPELISLLNAVKNSYNSYPVDSIAMKAAKVSILDDDYFKVTINKIIKTRNDVEIQLKELGFFVYPSHSNFLFVTHPKHNAKDIYEACKKENIYIRYFNLPRVQNHLRITIGTESDMGILLEFLKRYLEK